MAEIIGVPALGAAYGLLFAAVIEITKKNIMFKRSLKRVKATLKTLAPFMEDVKQLNEILTKRKQETEYFESQINKGEQLVRKCAKVGWYNIFKRRRYTNRLLKLDQTLQTLITFLSSARDRKETLIKVDKLAEFAGQAHEKLDSKTSGILDKTSKILDMIQGGQSISNTPPPPPPPSPPTSLPPPPLPRPRLYDVIRKKVGVPRVEVVSLRQAFGLLFDAVKEFAPKDGKLKTILNKLEATLKVLEPLFISREREIESLERESYLQGGEMADIKLEMVKGQELVRKWYNHLFHVSKRHYANKLLELDESLCTLFQMLQVQQAMDVKKNLVIIQEIYDKISGDGGSDVAIRFFQGLRPFLQEEDQGRPS